MPHQRRARVVLDVSVQLERAFGLLRDDPLAFFRSMQRTAALDATAVRDGRDEKRTPEIVARPLPRGVSDMAKRKKSVESFGSTIAVPNETASDAASAVKAAPAASAIAPRDSDEEESERAREDSRERVSARAYEIYLERGSSHGHDVEDWLEAERQVRRPYDE